MKKPLAFALLFAMLLPLAFAFSPSASAAASPVADIPGSYLWIDNTDNVNTSVTFTLPADKIRYTGVVTLKAKVFFGADVVKNGGSLYVNCYSFSNVEKAGNFDYLINFTDFATSNASVQANGESVPVIGRWADFSYEFDPFAANYASGRESTKVVITDGRAVSKCLNISIGAYLATGSMRVAEISLEQNGKTLWKAGFSKGFDPASPDPALYVSSTHGMTAETKGLLWGVVTSSDTSTPAPGDIKGDFNRDGKLSSDDAIYLLRHTLFGEDYKIYQDGDIDGNKKVNSADAVLVLRCVLFPDEYFQLRTVENVALGKKYTAGTGGYRTDSYGDSNDSRGVCPRFKLTDGASAPTGESSRIAGYGGSTTFYLDLEHLCRLTDMSIDLFGGVWGITSPRSISVRFSYSKNGVDYTSLGSIRPTSANAKVTELDGGWVKCVYTAPGKNALARYIRVEIESPDYVWPSELTVNGYELKSEGDVSDIPRIYIDTKDGAEIIKDDYRDCTIKVIDPTGKYADIADNLATVKIRGNSTSGGAKSPYNIKFNKKQDVFGFGKCKKWYLLANMYDKTQIRNKLAYTLADEIGMAYVHQSTFVELYVNGVYRGLYQLCESIGAGDTRVDIDITGNEFLFEYEPWPQYSNEEWYTTPRYGIILGLNDPESPTAEQRAYLEEFFTAMENAIHSQKYSEIVKYVDLDSFIDAFIVQEFFKEVDYATSSTRFYLKDGKLYEGPVWDFDLSAGNCSSSYYTGYNNVGGSGLSYEGDYCYGIWNRRLFRVPEIMDMVKARYAELQPYIVNVYEDNELGKNQLDLLLEKYGDDIRRNYTIWSLAVEYSVLEKLPEDGTYESEINYLRDWFRNRNEWLKNRYGIN